MRSGLRGGTGPWGQCKTPGMLGFIRAQRGSAQGVIFSRVRLIKDGISGVKYPVIFFAKIGQLSWDFLI